MKSYCMVPNNIGIEFFQRSMNEKTCVTAIYVTPNSDAIFLLFERSVINYTQMGMFLCIIDIT